MPRSRRTVFDLAHEPRMVGEGLDPAPGKRLSGESEKAQPGDTPMTDTTKVALVTGAARGIGLAAAKRFLAEGWRVALLDINAETLHAAHAAIANPKDTIAIECDVSQPDAVSLALETVSQHFGRLDALVNNAGIAIFKPILDVTYEDWSRVLAVNLTGPFLMTQAAAPIMRDGGGGAIVNITSISGLARLDLAHRLRHQQSRPRASDQAAGRRTGRTRHSRQCGGARPGRYRDGQGRAHAGNPRRLSRPHAAQPLRAGNGTGRGRSSFCAATERATSPGKCCASMAASTRPASACRPCARKCATASASRFRTTPRNPATICAAARYRRGRSA